MIYFVLAPELKVVKIGFTVSLSSLRTRLVAISTGCPAETKLFGTIQHRNADVGLESKLHNHFSGRHKIKEWFYYDDSMLEEISSMDHFVLAIEPKAWNHAEIKRALEIDRLLKEGKLSGVEIAKRMSVSVNAVSNLKRGKRWGNITGRKNIVDKKVYR